MTERQQAEQESIEALADGVQRIANHIEHESMMRQADIFASTRERMERERRERAERRANIATAAAVVSAVAAVLGALLGAC
jgi:hypothetical protein